MSDPWNSAWEEAAASCPPSVAVHCTLELWHISFDVPVRAVTGVADDMNLTLEVGAPRNSGESVTFKAIPFRADFPEVGERMPPQIKVTIDNAARELAPYIDGAINYRGDLVALYREWRSDDLTAPCYGPVEFIIKKVTVVGESVVGVAQIANLANRRFPKKNYTLAEFPSLLP